MTSSTMFGQDQCSGGVVDLQALGRSRGSANAGLGVCGRQRGERLGQHLGGQFERNPDTRESTGAAFGVPGHGRRRLVVTGEQTDYYDATPEGVAATYART